MRNHLKLGSTTLRRASGNKHGTCLLEVNVKPPNPCVFFFNADRIETSVDPYIIITYPKSHNKPTQVHVIATI
jgi:hypothetical protein